MNVSLMSFGQWLEHSSVSSAVEHWPYFFMAVSVAHFFSFFLVVGTSVVVDLLLLGLAGRRHNIAQLAENLFPWMWAALGMAALTGFLMFAPAATTFFKIAYFFLKLLGIVLALAVVLIIQWKMRKWDQAPAIPTVAKLTAFVSLVLWIGTLISALEIAQYANI